MSEEFFRIACEDARRAGLISKGGLERVLFALYGDPLEEPEEVDPDAWACVICGQDCRDAFGGASRACRQEYNAD